ncbi:MAG: flagellar biosynthetic protein FliQ [bacterium]|nr:flagellar biosynthetic protein FliQ [bacterium]
MESVAVLSEYLAKGFMIMLSISMPCVLTAAAIGLVVGIIQAVTQVQEQTISAAPKIFAVFLVIIIGGMGFIKLLQNLFYEGTALAFNGVTKSDNYVLPANYYKYTSPFEGEMNDKISKGDFNYIMKNPGKIPFIDKQQRLRYDSAPKTPMPKPNFVETNKILGR